MSTITPQPPTTNGTPPLAEAAHLVLYDGVCGLCGSLLRFLLTHDRRGVFAFASLQSAIGRAVVEGLGGDPTELTSFYVVANYRTGFSRTFARHSQPSTRSKLVAPVVAAR